MMGLEVEFFGKYVTEEFTNFIGGSLDKGRNGSYRDIGFMEFEKVIEDRSLGIHIEESKLIEGRNGDRAIL